VWAQIIWQLNQTLKFQVEHCMHFTSLSQIERLNHSQRSQEIHHINAIYIIVEGSHLVLCEKRQAKHMSISKLGVWISCNFIHGSTFSLGKETTPSNLVKLV
jgi:hypothetical protein